MSTCTNRSSAARHTGNRRIARTFVIAAAAFTAMAGWTSRASAVSVSPNALYLDHRNRSGMLTLFNGGTLPEEIEITFAFGYPTSDSLGQIGVPLVEIAPEGEPSAVPWMRAFPRRIRLAPGQRQVVRILANPPAGLPEGEFWARIVVTAKGGQPPIEQREGDIRLRLDVQTMIVAAASYRNGSVSTGLAVQRAVASAGDSIVSMFDLERTGNAAWIGRLVTQLVSPSGQVVAEVEDHLAVYRGLRFRSALGRPAGVASLAGYTIRFAFDTQRIDLPADGPLRAPRVSGDIPLQ